eukprot:5460298-Pyramimonas_sp.AAC.1
MPILFSHKIAELAPDLFWCGGGEVDLKLGMSAAEFIKRRKGLWGVECTFAVIDWHRRMCQEA